MGELFAWIQANWSSAIGAVGIIGSLWFTAAYFRADSETRREENKNRQVSNLLAIEEKHAAIWSEAQQRKELARILARDVDLTDGTVSPEEDVFLRRVILRFETGWRIETILDRGEMRLLARDVGDFFSLPLPSIFWKKTRDYRNPSFVKFVEDALEPTRL